MASYSPGGIHPQCAEKQADVKRVKRLKAANVVKTPKEEVAKSSVSKFWQNKVCPKCRANLHIRKLTCVCGHRFSPAGGA
jgi:hypothetical protein